MNPLIISVLLNMPKKASMVLKYLVQMVIVYPLMMKMGTILQKGW